MPRRVCGWTATRRLARNRRRPRARRPGQGARRRVFVLCALSRDRASMLRAVPAVPVALLPDGRDAHSWDDATRALLGSYAAAVARGAPPRRAPPPPQWRRRPPGGGTRAPRPAPAAPTRG